MNPPISVMRDEPFLKQWRYSLVRMKYLSFHLENNLSLCCQRSPFLWSGDDDPPLEGPNCGGASDGDDDASGS